MNYFSNQHQAALPVKENEDGYYVTDNSRAECVGMPPTVVNAKAGEEATIEVAFPASNLDVGKYELICACIGGFLPTDITFDVVAATDAPAIIVDRSAVQDNAEWYDMQGRKFTTKPSEPGIYINCGKKILIK